MTFNELKDFLDEKVEKYNRPDFFIETDPIQIPKMFSQKQDIEISGFLASVIAWGQRKTIINNSKKLMELMDSSPYDFVINHQTSDLERFNDFVHRTFNGQDVKVFLTSLKKIYQKNASLEDVLFDSFSKTNDLQKAISDFKFIFFENTHSLRSLKHLPDPEKGSAAKRFNMFLRWLVRKDKAGVDFGIWNKIPQSELSCPLDVHSGRVARLLGLLKREQNDAKALKELDSSLRALDPKDPSKYDFALFGLGVFEGFK